MLAKAAVAGMGLGLAVAAVGTVYFSNKAGGIPYEYASARIRFRQGKLISKSNMEELADAKALDEIIAYLEGHEMYNKIMTEVRRSSSGEQAIYETLRQKALADLHFLHSIAPPESRDLVEQYAKRYEIENIKNALRVKSLGLSEKLTNEVYAGLTEGQVDEMFSVDSPEAVVGLLSATEYGKVLDRGMKQHRETGSLLGFEGALDAYYMKNLLRAVGGVRKNEKADALVNIYISCIGLKVVFRAIMEKVPLEEMEAFIISNQFLPKAMLKSLSGEDVVGTIERLSTRWKAVFEPVKNEFTKSNDLSVLERRLDRYLQEAAAGTMIADYVGPGMLLGYLMRTESEVRNLMTITSAKSANMAPEAIKELLV